MRGISEDERALMSHISRWGSDGYPVRKTGRGWTWGPWRSIQGPPTVFKTKREAVAMFERFLDVLLEAHREMRAEEMRQRETLTGVEKKVDLFS